VSAPATHRCERCRTRLATVTLGDVVGGTRETYRICSTCWTDLSELCPRERRTDEDAVVHFILDELRDDRRRAAPEAQQ